MVASHSLRHHLRHSPPQSELFLFMEYCPEGNVWLLAQQGLPEALVRRYTCQILLGVNAIHEHGIVHRDIKGE